jgi:hypothetical protein
LFADSCSNRVWSLGGIAVGLQDLTWALRPTNGDSFSGIVALGEDGLRDGTDD